MAKILKEAPVQAPDNKTYITLEGLKTFKTEYDKKLNGNIANHTHTPEQIVETETKKFVSQSEKDRWNDTYTKSETDGKVSTLETKLTDKIDALEKARVWKPSVATKDDIATTYPEPQDTWCVIAKDTNIMWMYDAETQEWIDLGHSVIHDNATQEKDGLMSKEDKAKLDGLEQKITTAYQAADKVIDDKVNAMDTAYKAADTKINETITAMDTAYKQADTELNNKVTALTETHNTDKTELENKIAEVDAKFISATAEQIQALFA